MAKTLILRGAAINYINNQGKTALHLALESKNMNAVKFLLNKDARVEIVDN